MIRILFMLAAISCMLSTQAVSAPLDIGSYAQTNLVSDLSGVAITTDPNLMNPWGIAFSATSPFWISDNKTGVSTLYNGAGQPFPVANPLVVTIPPPLGGLSPAAPTGIVFAGIPTSFSGASFIFATEDGTISAWSGGTSAVLKVDNSPSGAVYKGLALGNNGSGNFLYATNFNSGNIDVFNSTFAPVTLAGNFKDSSLPTGFAPFNIENIQGKLYVTYAMQDTAKHDDVAGPGNGYVDVYDLNGNLLDRLISNGPLNSPWGMTLASPNFGAFSGDLLVGNFGDGTISGFNPVTGALIGQLADQHGNPIVDPGLWALTFGNGGNGGNPNILYLTAGIPGPDNVEDHGLFAQIQAVPEPGTWVAAGLGLTLLLLAKRAGIDQKRPIFTNRA